MRIETLDPARQAGELRALRAQAGLATPADAADQALDALSYHVLARTGDGQALGSAPSGASTAWRCCRPGAAVASAARCWPR
ncbi:hypothetical protein ATB54_14430 [Xanthomonas translucens]|nr:hypothetical protein ATB54_14430 [Xanthomonas translucens]